MPPEVLPSPVLRTGLAGIKPSEIQDIDLDPDGNLVTLVLHDGREFSLRPLRGQAASPQLLQQGVLMMAAQLSGESDSQRAVLALLSAADLEILASACATIQARIGKELAYRAEDV